jgi:hypothetical protein
LQLDLLYDELRRLIVRPGDRPAGWTDAESRHVLLVAQCAVAAKTPSDLQCLQILRLRTCPDDPPGTSSVQLSAKRLLVITFKTDSIPMTAVFDVMSPVTEGS